MSDETVYEDAEMLVNYNLEVYEPGSPDYFLFQRAQRVACHVLRQLDEAARAIAAECEARGE